MATTTTIAAARHWLAQADDDHDRALRWLDTTGEAMLPVARTWDVIRITAAPLVDAALTHADTPTIRDDDGLYLLVLAGTATAWSVPGSEALDGDCYISVPAPDRTTGPGPYWATPPDGTGRLADAATLARTLHAARNGAPL